MIHKSFITHHSDMQFFCCKCNEFILIDTPLVVKWKPNSLFIFLLPKYGSISFTLVSLALPNALEYKQSSFKLFAIKMLAPSLCLWNKKLLCFQCTWSPGAKCSGGGYQHRKGNASSDKFFISKYYMIWNVFILWNPHQQSHADDAGFSDVHKI